MQTETPNHILIRGPRRVTRLANIFHPRNWFGHQPLRRPAATGSRPNPIRFGLRKRKKPQGMRAMLYVIHVCHWQQTRVFIDCHTTALISRTATARSCLAEPSGPNDAAPLYPAPILEGSAQKCSISKLPAIAKVYDAPANDGAGWRFHFSSHSSSARSLSTFPNRYTVQ